MVLNDIATLDTNLFITGSARLKKGLANGLEGSMRSKYQPFYTGIIITNEWKTSPMKQTVIGVFEDDKIDRFIYERLFSHYLDSPVVHVFDNAKEGIEKAREIGFDMVYIDLHFWEDFGGESILKELRQVSDREMISLAMTSILQAGDHERVTDAGFDLCMEKADFFRGLNMMQLS